MWLVFTTLSVYTYGDEQLLIFTLLENLFFVFLFGLFFSNLHNELDKYKIKNQYLNLRLKELTNRLFYTKNIS